MTETTATTGQDNTDTGSVETTQAEKTSLLNGNGVQEETKPENTETQSEETKATEEGEKKEAAPVVPEKYDLKAPEGFEIDEALLGDFEPVAKELKLTNEGAQKLVETMMPKVVQRIADQQQAAYTDMLEGWAGTIKADKEIGGDNLKPSLVLAEKALAKFGTPELNALLNFRSEKNPNGFGLGNNPELVRVFARIGKAMAEDKLHTSGGNTSGEKKSAAEVLYGNNS